MAKKRRITQQVEEEEEYEFIPPDFDEKEFILKDLYGTKITMIVTLFAIILGILCSCVQKCFSGNTGMWLGLLLYFLALFGIKPFIKLFVKLNILEDAVDKLEGKSMIGNYLMYLLLAMGVWILFINPPFW